MATVQQLREEAACSVCLEHFTDPVSIPCGFCRACIARCWAEVAAGFSCPRCRATAPWRDLRPSRELASMVQLVKQLEPGQGQGQGRCGAHGEPLKLFCEQDRRPVCVVCDRSRAHRKHPVLPIRSAAQEGKEQIRTRLQALREEREKLLRRRQAEEEKSQEYLEQTRAERQKIGAEILQFRQLLEEQERLLLARLGALEKELAKRQKESGDRLAAEISRLGELIGELEGKCRQPADLLVFELAREGSRRSAQALEDGGEMGTCPWG